MVSSFFGDFGSEGNRSEKKSIVAPPSLTTDDGHAASRQTTKPLLTPQKFDFVNGVFSAYNPRKQAMTALGVLVQGNAGAQTSLARTNITVVGKPLPVVQALLRTALRAPSPAERAAGDGVLRRLCVGNEQVQLELLGTISPVEPGKRRRKIKEDVLEKEKRKIKNLQQ